MQTMPTDAEVLAAFNETDTMQACCERLGMPWAEILPRLDAARRAQKAEYAREYARLKNITYVASTPKDRPAAAGWAVVWHRGGHAARFAGEALHHGGAMPEGLYVHTGGGQQWSSRLRHALVYGTRAEAEDVARALGGDRPAAVGVARVEL